MNSAAAVIVSVDTVGRVVVVETVRSTRERDSTPSSR
jgi:hypothetical protein